MIINFDKTSEILNGIEEASDEVKKNQLMDFISASELGFTISELEQILLDKDTGYVKGLVFQDAKSKFTVRYDLTSEVVENLRNSYINRQMFKISKKASGIYNVLKDWSFDEDVLASVDSKQVELSKLLSAMMPALDRAIEGEELYFYPNTRKQIELAKSKISVLNEKNKSKSSTKCKVQNNEIGSMFKEIEMFGKEKK